MNTEYILVLQWSSDRSKSDLDRLVATEDYLLENLSAPDGIDGHDIGPGEMNIFIYCDDPARVFAELRSLLQPREEWHGLRAGFRRVDDDEYVVLWPEQLAKFAVV